MIVALLIDGIEVKEFWWPDVKFGCDAAHHENLRRHINGAVKYCEATIQHLVNPARCTWCVKINSRGKAKTIKINDNECNSKLQVVHTHR